MDRREILFNVLEGFIISAQWSRKKRDQIKP